MLHFLYPPRKRFERLFVTTKKPSKNIQTPLANINERKEEYIITLAAPGLNRQNLHINVSNNKMFIKAEKEDKQATKESNSVQSEYDFREWAREFILPANADSYFIHAFYTNGELEVHIPKSDQPIHSNAFTIDVY